MTEENKATVYYTVEFHLGGEPSQHWLAVQFPTKELAERHGERGCNPLRVATSYTVHCHQLEITEQQPQ